MGTLLERAQAAGKDVHVFGAGLDLDAVKSLQHELDPARVVYSPAVQSEAEIRKLLTWVANPVFFDKLSLGMGGYCLCDCRVPVFQQGFISNGRVQQIMVHVASKRRSVMNMEEIRTKAKQAGVKPSGTKAAVIHRIQRAEGNQPCFRTRSQCLQMDCCWRKDCLPKNSFTL